MSEERIELVIPITGGTTTVTRHYGGTQPDEKVFVGDREQLGRMLVKALADLTGDPLLTELSGETEFNARDVACVVNTLGEVIASGVELDSEHFSTYQITTADNLSFVWSNVIHGECGRCGSEEHATKDCTTPAGDL